MGATQSEFYTEFNKDSSKEEWDAWHTTISPDAARMFGHTNTKTRSYINYFLEKLPKVDPEPNIVVGFTGYWDKAGEITAPLYAQTVDSVGRPMFFIDNDVIIQRYTTADTLIYYNRKGCWSHNLADGDTIANWYEKVVKWEKGLE